jgi:alpha-galactosidase/6-phospho-beta-glucosidase family protein
MLNICILGSSTSWFPYLLPDLMSVFKEPLEIRLIDIDPRPAKLCGEFGKIASKHSRRKNDKYRVFTNRKEALKGADAVIITLSTGGLDAMEQDLKIPEKYGICATVGDTAGPGGWSRSIRNIPVFRRFADDFQKYCPRAFIANYTNPMASLTATLQQCCGNPSVGLCHAYFETKDVIQHLFGLKDWSRISISIAGMNHFTWVVDFKIGKEDGYALLRKKVGRGSLHEVLPKHSDDDIGFRSHHNLCAELYDMYGYLPYPADRHTSEFVSFAMCGKPEIAETRYKDNDGTMLETIKYCSIKRTPIEQRRSQLPTRIQNLKDLLKGKKPIPGRSRETGAEMIRAYLYNQPFTDAVNTLNIGQVPGLPLGSCLETLGVVDGLGVRPLMVNKIPDPLLEVMRPQAICQKWITQGVLEGNKDLLLQALYRDPQCAHLKPNEVRQMAKELFQANAKYCQA